MSKSDGESDFPAAVRSPLSPRTLFARQVASRALRICAGGQRHSHVGVQLHSLPGRELPLLGQLSAASCCMLTLGAATTKLALQQRRSWCCLLAFVRSVLPSGRCISSGTLPLISGSREGSNHSTRAALLRLLLLLLLSRGLSAYATTSATSELSPQPSQAHSPGAPAPQGPSAGSAGSAGAAPQRSMQVSVCAVGMALQFMQLQHPQQAQQGLQREGSMGAAGGAGSERPGSAASGEERSRHSRAGSVESMASLRRASSAELAQQGALQRTKQVGARVAGWRNLRFCLLFKCEERFHQGEEWP